MEITFSLAQINDVAKQIIENNPHKVILFNGEMGVGKTTLIKTLAAQLGVKETTSSPTFSLVNEYKTMHCETVYHFDVYRLKNETEAFDMGIDEYLYSGAWCFIEWAEKIPNLVPEIHTVIDISLLSDGQRFLQMTQNK